MTGADPDDPTPPAPTASRDPAAPPQPGESVGPYRLLHLLGQGGMSRVYAAEPLDGGDPVALKLLRPELVGHKRTLRRFMAEARAVARLGHPHVVALRDAGQAQDGHVYFALELLRGETLGTRLRRDGRLPLGPAVAIAEQVASALAAAHGAGVLHRDVKPDNVLLLADAPDQPWAKLLDFGIAKIAGERVSTDRRTGQGTALGTIEYMAPEQCVGAEVDARSDIYALGAVLYHMLVGELPYRDVTWERMVLWHMREGFPPVRKARPEVPSRLAELVAAAVAKDPRDRPVSMLAVRDALGAIRGDAAAPRRRWWPFRG